jgi:hypothetical protein
MSLGAKPITPVTAMEEARKELLKNVMFTTSLLGVKKAQTIDRVHRDFLEIVEALF